MKHSPDRAIRRSNLVSLESFIKGSLLHFIKRPLKLIDLSCPGAFLMSA